jgi:hypothetical protein
MALTEDEVAKIILIRSIEECDKSVFSDQVLTDALAAAKNENPGLDWIRTRASYLFERLSAWHQSILQLAKVPANWTLPVSLLAVFLGLATNLLGPTEKIHVVRNPVFFLVAWNLLVYLGLLLLLLRNRFRLASGLVGQLKSSARDGDRKAAPSFGEPTKVPWMVRYLMPRIWQFVHKIMFGFHQTRNLAKLTSFFTMYWLSLAGPLVVARWRYLLHLAALCIAAGAVVGMYLRGLFQGYEFVWASTFIISEQTVSGFINLLFGPSFFISSLLNLGLAERIDIARAITPQGDKSDAWIHLFAITVVIAVLIPRGALALFQSKKIKTLANRVGLALDKYYGDVIEAPIRSIVDKEARAAVTRFAEKLASYVGLTLYDQQITPKLRQFRENGGRISDLKTELTELTEAFSPQVKAYIVDTAIPEFQLSLSQRVGEIIKSIGTDFVNNRDPEASLHDLKIDAPETAELGVSNQFSKAIGISVGAAISLTFATVAGGIGEELGIAVVAAILGTTGPVGFVIGLIVGGLLAAGAWWFGKDKITEAVDSVKLPAVALRTVLWESRFKKLIEDGRSKCLESVQTKVKEGLTPILPKITDEIMFRIRSLWEP